MFGLYVGSEGQGDGLWTGGFLCFGVSVFYWPGSSEKGSFIWSVSFFYDGRWLEKFLALVFLKQVFVLDLY